MGEVRPSVQHIHLREVQLSSVCSLVDIAYVIAAGEMANMFAYYKRFPYYDEMREPSKCIYKGPSFAEWAQQNAEVLKAQIPA